MMYPVAEYLVRRKHSLNVRNRIERMNLRGCEEGSHVRGWHPHQRIDFFSIGLISVARFVQKYGQEAYRKLPKHALYRQGHRKAILYNYIARNFPAR